MCVIYVILSTRFFFVLASENGCYELERNEIACLSCEEQSIEIVAWVVLFMKMKAEIMYTLPPVAVKQCEFTEEFKERNQEISFLSTFKITCLCVFVCDERTLELFNFDSQDVPQHSLKSTMDFWYKFTQPQTFPSFVQRFFSSVSLSPSRRRSVVLCTEIKSRHKWRFSFDKKQSWLKFYASIDKVQCVFFSPLDKSEVFKTWTAHAKPIRTQFQFSVWRLSK